MDAVKAFFKLLYIVNQVDYCLVQIFNFASGKDKCFLIINGHHYISSKVLFSLQLRCYIFNLFFSFFLTDASQNIGKGLHGR